MILVRAVRRFGEARPVDAVPAAELRAWLLELRASLAPESIAGYVRGLKAFGNWCATRGGRRGGVASEALRRPKVPHRLIAPFSDPELRSLLALADERERALALRPPRHRAPPVRARLAAGRRRPARWDAPCHGQGRQGADRADRRDRPAGARPLPRDPARAVGPGDPLFCGRWGPALTARGIQQAIARLGRRAAVGTRCSPAHVPPHVRPRLSRQRRRRVQPPADPRPRDARHGPPLREPVRGRSRGPPSDGLAGGSAGRSTRSYPILVHNH